MDASIVICTYNRAANLERVLASLCEMSVPPEIAWEVLVVDNNSRDATREVVERMAGACQAPVRYLFEREQGKTHALNRGVAEARGEILLFTDDDVLVHPHWVQEMVAAFAAHDCLGIGGKIEAVWGRKKPIWFSNTGPYRLFGAIIEYDFGEGARAVVSPPFGANMAFRREAFTRYGLFRTDLGIVGTDRIIGEDSEFSGRLLRGGEEILYLPAALIYHPVEPERTKKPYFVRWYYDYGRTVVRAYAKAEPSMVRYFGVPRHLFRTLLTDGVRWMTALTPRRRFYYKLRCCQHCGEISEYYRTSRAVAGAQ